MTSLIRLKYRFRFYKDVWEMFLVKLLRHRKGQLRPLVHVHPELPCVAQVIVDDLNVSDKMVSLCCQAEVVLLLVLRQSTHLIMF